MSEIGRFEREYARAALERLDLELARTTQEGRGEGDDLSTVEAASTGRPRRRPAGWWFGPAVIAAILTSGLMIAWAVSENGAAARAAFVPEIQMHDGNVEQSVTVEGSSPRGEEPAAAPSPSATQAPEASPSPTPETAPESTPEDLGPAPTSTRVPLPDPAPVADVDDEAPAPRVEVEEEPEPEQAEASRAEPEDEPEPAPEPSAASGTRGPPAPVRDLLCDLLCPVLDREDS